MQEIYKNLSLFDFKLYSLNLFKSIHPLIMNISKISHPSFCSFEFKTQLFMKML